MNTYWASVPSFLYLTAGVWVDIGVWASGRSILLLSIVDITCYIKVVASRFIHERTAARPVVAGHYRSQDRAQTKSGTLRTCNVELWGLLANG